MKQFAINLKNAAVDNPVATVLVAAMAVSAVAKLVAASGSAVGSAAYARDVNRRVNAAK